MSFTPGAGTRFLVTSSVSQASGPALTGPLSITGGTATANVPVLNATQTWNNAAVTFTGWQLNVTDTASNANSLLMDLQVGGTGRFRVTKSGWMIIGSDLSSVGSSGRVYLFKHPVNSNDVYFYNVGETQARVVVQGQDRLGFAVNALVSRSDGTIGFSPSTDVGLSPDAILARDAANTLAQRNGVNAQTKRLYGTFTDASNYRRLAMAMTTGGVASIAPEGAGTGASGNVLHISGLPTANPGPGILWNDAGTVKVGT